MPDAPAPPPQLPADSAARLALAYLELARRWHMPLALETGTGIEAESTIESLDPRRGRLTLAISNAPSAGLEPDDEVRLFLGLEEGRWMGRAVVQHYRDNRRLFVLSLPRELTAQDRRRTPRTREVQDLKVLIRPQEFSGSAFHGTLMDLAEGGLQMRVERHSEGTADEAEEALREGLDLAVVRLGVPGGREIECQGRLVHLSRGRAGLLAGIRFRNLNPEGRQWLEGYLAPRVHPTVTELPPLAFTPEAEPEPTADLPSQEDSAARVDALLRLKKRGRTLLLAMPTGQARLDLVNALLADGYGRVLVVEHLWQVGEALQGQAVHCVFIDGGVQEVDPLELASFVFYARGDRRCAILLATLDPVRFPESALRQAGVDRLVPKPYSLPVLLPLLEVEMELRPREDVPEALLAAATAGGRTKVLRRIRAVALVMPPGPQRDALSSLLAGAGFMRVLPAGTIAELVQAMDSSALSLVFIDWPDPQLPGLEIAGFLEGLRFRNPVTVVLASDRPSPRLVEDARTLGVAHLVVRPYELESGFAELLASFLLD